MTLPASAHAAAPWSEPQALTGVGGPPVAKFNAVGRGLITAYSARDTLDPRDDATVGFSTDAADRPAGRFNLTPPGFQAVAPRSFALVRRDHVLIAGVRFEAVPSFAWAGLARLGSTTETDRLRLARGEHATGAWTAGNLAGDSAVVVRACRRNSGCTLGRLVLFRRPRGHPFQAGITLSRRASRGPVALSMNPRGDLLVGASIDLSRGRRWFASYRVSARGYKVFEPLGPGGHQGYASATLTSSGRAVLIWMRQGVSECEPSREASVLAAVKPVGRRFAGARVLDRFRLFQCGHYVSEPGVASAQGGGRIYVAWTSRNRLFSPRVAAVGSTRISAPVAVAPGDRDATLDGLVVGPQGQQLAVWTLGRAGHDGDNRGPMSLNATTRTGSSGGFSAPEVISPDAGFPTSSVALNPVSGRVLVVWDPVAQQPQIRFSVREPLSR